MKHLYLFIFSIVAYFANAQNSSINFDYSNNKAVVKSGNLQNISLPLTINFSKSFAKKTFELRDIKGNRLSEGVLVFGKGDLSKNEDETFSFMINVNHKTNPGNYNVGNDLQLIIAEQLFVLSFHQNSAPIPSSNAITTQTENYISGYMIADALSLSDEHTSPQLKMAILKAYQQDQNNNLQSNPYLSELVGSNYFTKALDTANAGQMQGSGIAPTAFLSSLGGMDVTNIAAGMARFLAERTKEELNEAFFNKMKQQLNAYPELKTIFPNTASFLNVIEGYSHASVIQVLKEAFETDIQNLPENLYQIKNLSRVDCNAQIISKQKSLQDCQARLDSIKSFFNSKDGLWIGLSMYTIKEGMKSGNPAELLNNVVASTEFSYLKEQAQLRKHTADYNVASAIALAQLLSQSLMTTSDNQVWVNSNELNSLIKNKKAFKTYLGLLLASEQMGNSQVDFYKADGSLFSFGTLLKDKFDTYQTIESLIKETHSAFHNANLSIKKMNAANQKSIEVDPQALYDYYKTFTASIKPIAHSALLNSIIKNDMALMYDSITQYLNPSMDMCYHLSTKKYSAAVYDAVLLLNNVKAPVFEKPVLKSFIKYGTLISSVANAQSSDEVKKAIEASVLPVGSAAIKRKSNWSIAANAYVGGYYGIAHTTRTDTLRNTSTNKTDTITSNVSYRTFGLYAPIGLSFNKGFTCGWGLSIVAQVIDLGGVVNFYLTEGDKAAMPDNYKIKLADIIAPGAQLALNIPKTPISIMGGIQYVPSLNTANQIKTSSNIINPIAWRTQLGIVVDIPLYNLKVWDFKK